MELGDGADPAVEVRFANVEVRAGSLGPCSVANWGYANVWCEFTADPEVSFYRIAGATNAAAMDYVETIIVGTPSALGLRGTHWNQDETNARVLFERQVSCGPDPKVTVTKSANRIVRRLRISLPPFDGAVTVLKSGRLFPASGKARVARVFPTGKQTGCCGGIKEPTAAY